jgi:hypothetical protein
MIIKTSKIKTLKKANADAVRDVPHVCFCAKKAKTMMLRL